MLVVNRIYKYLDKYLFYDAPGVKDVNIDVDVLSDELIDTDIACNFE